MFFIFWVNISIYPNVFLWFVFFSLTIYLYTYVCAYAYANVSLPYSLNFWLNLASNFCVSLKLVIMKNFSLQRESYFRFYAPIILRTNHFNIPLNVIFLSVCWFFKQHFWVISLSKFFINFLFHFLLTYQNPLYHPIHFISLIWKFTRFFNKLFNDAPCMHYGPR